MLSGSGRQGLACGRKTVKSESRVKGYKKGSGDWRAEYNMLLEDGVKCVDCLFSEKCRKIFGGDDNNTSCQFYPNRFQSIK